MVAPRGFDRLGSDYPALARPPRRGLGPSVSPGVTTIRAPGKARMPGHLRSGAASSGSARTCRSRRSFPSRLPSARPVRAGRGPGVRSSFMPRP